MLIMSMILRLRILSSLVLFVKLLRMFRVEKKNRPGRGGSCVESLRESARWNYLAFSLGYGGTNGLAIEWTTAGENLESLP